MAVGRAVVLDIVQQSVRNFEHSLICNILIRSVQESISIDIIWLRAAYDSLVLAYCMPNLMPLKCLGSLSTNCCLLGLSAEIAMIAVTQESYNVIGDRLGVVRGMCPVEGVAPNYEQAPRCEDAVRPRS